jgi:predicted HTH transcriptional regulator
MTTPIEQLIQAPEGKTLEFKRDLSSPRPLLKTLLAFANTAGGRLLIGVTDDRQVVGVADPLAEEERLCNMIADAIAPRLVPNIELFTVQGKTLLQVEVFLSGLRPHYLKAAGPENGVFVRLGSSNRQADPQLIAELQRSVEGISYDEMAMPDLSVDDLDLEAARKFFAGKRSLTEQELITLKLLVRYQDRLVPSKGAVLLFGRERLFHFADAWVQCGRFLGTEKVDIFDHIDIDVPLPAAVNEVMLFLKKHAYRGADLSGIRRRDVWSIPLPILREVIINALVHADYSQRGAPIRVVFLDDRIEVENPGILLPGLTVEDMKQGTSKIRNPVIARVFRELDLIEQWGTGIRRIFQEAEKQGLPEPQIIEVGMRVKVIVPLKEAIVIPQGVESPTQSPAQSPTQSDKQINKLIQCLQDGEKSAGELRNMLGLKHRQTFRENYLHPALEQGVIERTIPEKPNSRLQKYRLVEK